LKNTELKTINRKQIFQLIYERENIAKSDIASILNLSFPTVSQSINELEELKVVEKTGYFQSAGGRKAVIISSVSDAKVSIGVEVIKESVEIVAVDIYGNILKQENRDLMFENSPLYFSRFGNIINNFIISLNIPYEKILGVGIAIQGLVSQDGSKVIYGNILNCDGITNEDFGDFIQFPCILFHDSEAAADAELWSSTELVNAFYFSLSRNVGGAAIINSKVHWGLTYPSGLIEHMTINPKGEKCYCGKRGCLETYCSGQSLLMGLDKTLDQFFSELREGEEEHGRRWGDFLYYLSVAIDNLQMAINCDIIIGGHIAQHMNAEDIGKLTEMASKDSSFNAGRQSIRLAKCPSAAKGAALHYIKHFLDTIVQG
jgi:N-acetylglucosamine repressor